MSGRCLRTAALSFVVLAGGLGGKAFAQTPTVSCTSGNATQPANGTAYISNQETISVFCEATGFVVEAPASDRAFTINYEAAIENVSGAVRDPAAQSWPAGERYYETFTLDGTNVHSRWMSQSGGVSVRPKIRARVAYYAGYYQVTVYDPPYSSGSGSQPYKYGGYTSYSYGFL